MPGGGGNLPACFLPNAFAHPAYRTMSFVPVCEAHHHRTQLCEAVDATGMHESSETLQSIPCGKHCWQHVLKGPNLRVYVRNLCLGPVASKPALGAPVAPWCQYVRVRAHSFAWPGTTGQDLAAPRTTHNKKNSVRDSCVGRTFATQPHGKPLMSNAQPGLASSIWN